MAKDTLQDLLERAINFIVERESDDDFICEQMPPEYCAMHCTNLCSECVIEFLNNYYEPKKKD